MRKKIFLAISLILIFGGLYSLQFYFQEQEGLPKYAQKSPQVQAAYEYALEKPELLRQIPCYCGCSRIGHKNVEDCFVKEFKDNGKIVFDDHGANCGICYFTALDSKALFEQGKSPQEVKNFIDEKYSRYGSI